ncbi:uncharacterized protein LOC119388015 [Rhipicephalus sanguineus]|uniref:uncharacterized protein LOC119388015 n=1 Tax=Rhipicephalus sanguineus TaxID=34632 RepID=UPI0020C1CC1F|nr:uncharacterized protein LOC119388015 [Rhipicephalus sanguineus]
MSTKEAASSSAFGTVKEPCNMSEYQTEERNEEQSYRVTKKADIRFNMMTFRYKKRNEVEGPPGQSIPPASQIQAQLEDGGEPSWFPWLRSPTQLLLFLASGLLHFAMGLIVARSFLMPQFDVGTCPAPLFRNSTNMSPWKGWSASCHEALRCSHLQHSVDG